MARWRKGQSNMYWCSCGFAARSVFDFAAHMAKNEGKSGHTNVESV